MALFMRGIGRTGNGMVSVNRNGLMDRFTRASGKKISLQERASLFMLMETFTMEIGKMTRQMDKEYISMSMGHAMRGR
jgi:hypothetical protein